MDLALAIRHIWRYKRWLALVVALAIFAALSVSYRVSLLPPGIKSGSIESGAAKLGMLLDSRESALNPRDVSVGALGERAVLYAELLQSEPLRKAIGEHSGIPWRRISVGGQTDPGRAVEQPGQVQRAAQLVDEDSTTRLYFTVDPDYPIINLYAQAPSAETAISLVQAASESLTDYADGLQADLSIPIRDRAQLRQLGEPQGGPIAPGANLSVGLIAAFAVLIAGCFLILYIPRGVTAVRQAVAHESEWFPADPRRDFEAQPKPHDTDSHDTDSRPSGRRGETSRSAHPFP